MILKIVREINAPKIDIAIADFQKAAAMLKGSDSYSVIECPKIEIADALLEAIGIDPTPTPKQSPAGAA